MDFNRALARRNNDEEVCFYPVGSPDGNERLHYVYGQRKSGE